MDINDSNKEKEAESAKNTLEEILVTIEQDQQHKETVSSPPIGWEVW